MAGPQFLPRSLFIQISVTMTRKKSTTLLPTACGHHTRDQLSFLRAFQDAEQRLAKGEKQTQCPECHLWLWPEEMGVKPPSAADNG